MVLNEVTPGHDSDDSLARNRWRAPLSPVIGVVMAAVAINCAAVVVNPGNVSAAVVNPGDIGAAVINSGYVANRGTVAFFVIYLVSLVSSRL
jgi:hypothetical protein